MVNTKLSAFTPHSPAGLPLVKVNVTLPAVMSAALGVYVVATPNTPPPLKDPVPLLVHAAEGALLTLAPAIVYTPVSHIAASTPAFTTAAGVMFKTKLTGTAAHKPLPPAVNVNVTVAAPLSAVPGT